MKENGINEHSLQAKWQSVFGYKPKPKHISALTKKLVRECKVDEWIARLTEEDLFTVLRQVVKDDAGILSKNEPPQMGGK